MPYIYRENNREYLIPRTTEIAQTIVCEMSGYLHPIHERDRVGIENWKKIHKDKKIRNNLKAIAGTIIHGKIENFLRQQIGLQTEQVVLSPEDRKLLSRLMNNKQRFSIFINEIERVYNNFVSFWRDYKGKIKIIAIEKKLRHIVRKDDGTIDELNSFSGTIDLLTLFKTPVGWKILIIDWKSSVSSLPNHYIQLCGYFHLLTSSEYFKKLSAMLKNIPYYFHSGKPYTMCVLLGGAKYQVKWYAIKVEDFKRAQKKFRDPQPLTINHLTRNVGMQKFCMVCSYVYECEEFGFYSPSYPEIEMISTYSDDKQSFETIEKYMTELIA